MKLLSQHRDFALPLFQAWLVDYIIDYSTQLVPLITKIRHLQPLLLINKLGHLKIHLRSDVLKFYTNHHVMYVFASRSAFLGLNCGNTCLVSIFSPVRELERFLSRKFKRCHSAYSPHTIIALNCISDNTCHIYKRVKSFCACLCLVVFSHIYPKLFQHALDFCPD